MVNVLSSAFFMQSEGATWPTFHEVLFLWNVSSIKEVSWVNGDEFKLQQMTLLGNSSVAG